MVSVYSTLCRWTATSNFINAVKRQRNLGLVHYAPFLSFSTIYVLLQFLTLLTSMRIAIFRHFVFLMLLPVHTFFFHSSFLQFLTFPIPGRSIIIALNGDVLPRIKAPFPFQNILSRPWSVKISLTDETSCWIHMVKSWIYGLSSILHCREKWVYFKVSHTLPPFFRTSPKLSGPLSTPLSFLLI